MGNNKFDRTPVTDSIPEVSVPKPNPETNSETINTTGAKANCEGHVYAEGYKSIRLRKDPNENAEVITTIPVGENVAFGETINGWTKVNWSNLFSGWMMDKYIVRR